MVEILIGHTADPVSPYFSGYDFQVENFWVTSIYMAFWTVIFHAHNRIDLIREMTRSPQLRRNAVHIDRWVKCTGFTVSPAWLFRLQYVYYRVLLHVGKVINNTLTRRFLALRQSHGDDVQFILTSQHNDYVWSCGLSPTSNRMDRHHEFGFNLYGEILSIVYQEWYNGSIQDKAPIGEVMESMKMDADEQATKYHNTVLVLADSQCKQLQSVKAGKVISISGAKYHTLAKALQDSRIRVSEYKYIIISCGVNLCRHNNRSAWRKSWNQLANALHSILNSSDHYIIFNLPTWTTKAAFVDSHARFIKEETSDISHLRIVDWSSPVNNPFVSTDHQIVPRYFDRDGFHINHQGFRLFWNAWCTTFEELRPISYKLSVAPYQQV